MNEPDPLVFAGTPEFAATILAALLDEGRRVAAVFTQPDRPAGRGRRLRESAVKQLARERGLEVHQPASWREPKARGDLAVLRPTLMVVAAYGLLLPAPVLAVPRQGCVNVHASLLPRWRGAAPVQRALIAGDPETGVCLMRMDQGLDTGPVLARAAIPIADDDTGGSLTGRLARLGADLLARHLEALLRGSLRAEPQTASGACHAPRIDKGEARVDWSLGAAELERRVRAYDPWPVAFTTLPDGSRLRLWQARTGTDPGLLPPGTVLEPGPDCLRVATGAGVLEILELQPQGRGRMSASAWSRAHRLPPGTRLGIENGA